MESEICNYDNSANTSSSLANTTPGVYDLSTPDMSNVSEFCTGNGEVIPFVIECQTPELLPCNGRADILHQDGNETGRLI